MKIYMYTFQKYGEIYDKENIELFMKTSLHRH